MKSIKDILKSDSIEQRRRIAKNLAISKEDKNALIVNKSNGWGSDSNGIDIEYYKVTIPTDNLVRNVFQSVINFSSAFINCNQGRTRCIGPASIVMELDRAYDYDVLDIGFINKK